MGQVWLDSGPHLAEGIRLIYVVLHPDYATDGSHWHVAKFILLRDFILGHDELMLSVDELYKMEYVCPISSLVSVVKEDDVDNKKDPRDRIYVASHSDMNGWHHEVYMDNDLLYETDDDFRAYLFRAKLLTNG